MVSSLRTMLLVKGLSSELWGTPPSGPPWSCFTKLMATATPSSASRRSRPPPQTPDTSWVEVTPFTSVPHFPPPELSSPLLPDKVPSLRTLHKPVFSTLLFQGPLLNSPAGSCGFDHRQWHCHPGDEQKNPDKAQFQMVFLTPLSVSLVSPGKATKALQIFSFLHWDFA